MNKLTIQEKVVGAVVVFLLLAASALHQKEPTKSATQAAIAVCPEVATPKDFVDLCDVKMAVIE